MIQSRQATGAHAMRVLALLGTLCFLGVLSAGRAEAATSTSYCPTDGSHMSLNRYSSSGDRCTRYYANLVKVLNYNYNGYEVCAAAKPNADGSGGDVFAAVCAPYAAGTGIYGKTATYATIINHEAYGHTGFQGVAYSCPAGDRSEWC